MKSSYIYENEIADLTNIKGCIFEGIFEGKKMLFRLHHIGMLSGLMIFVVFNEVIYNLNWN